MSRIGAKPIEIPKGVSVVIEGRQVTVTGSKGNLAIDLPATITGAVENGSVRFVSTSDTRQSRSLHGLSRSLVANMVKGVSEGFTRDLEIEGVGFKGLAQGRKLSLSLGFSSPVVYEITEGVTVTDEGGTKLRVSGIDKQKVGEVAARIRAYFPAEPYKGKGVRYKGEHVRRKVGKTVA